MRAPSHARARFRHRSDIASPLGRMQRYLGTRSVLFPRQRRFHSAPMQNVRNLLTNSRLSRSARKGAGRLARRYCKTPIVRFELKSRDNSKKIPPFSPFAKSTARSCVNCRNATVEMRQGGTKSPSRLHEADMLRPCFEIAYGPTKKTGEGARDPINEEYESDAVCQLSSDRACLLGRRSGRQ
jgi:hypothetical protein